MTTLPGIAASAKGPAKGPVDGPVDGRPLPASSAPGQTDRRAWGIE